MLKSPKYADWKALWQIVREAISVPEGCELLRTYQNVYPFGADGCIHSDSDEPDEVTACIYLHLQWDKGWGGETVILDPNYEIRRAVLPTSGRLFAFRSVVPHGARPAARAAASLRCVLVMKMGPWLIERWVASGAQDAITGREGHGRGAEGVD